MLNRWIQVTGCVLAASATGLACKHFFGQPHPKPSAKDSADVPQGAQLPVAHPPKTDLLACPEALAQVPDLAQAQKQLGAPLTLYVQSSWASDEVYELKYALRQEGCQVELGLSATYPKYHQDVPEWKLVLRGCR